MHPVLAHQGGWDEALFVILPLALFVVILWAARRRAEDEADHEAHAEARIGDTTDGDHLASEPPADLQ